MIRQNNLMVVVSVLVFNRKIRGAGYKREYWPSSLAEYLNASEYAGVQQRKDCYDDAGGEEEFPFHGVYRHVWTRHFIKWLG